MKRTKKIISLLLIVFMMFNCQVPALASAISTVEEIEVANYTTKEGVKVVLTAEGYLVRQYENGILVADARPNDRNDKIISREYLNGKLDKSTTMDVNVMSGQPTLLNSYSYLGTMYYTNPIMQDQKNIKTYLYISYMPDQAHVIYAGTYKLVAIIASTAIGLNVSPTIAGGIIGSIFGEVASVTLAEAFSVRCNLWKYTWKGTSTPNTSYPDGFHYGTKAQVVSTGNLYNEGYSNVTDWKNNRIFQRLMYYNVYGIEVYPDYCQ